MSSQDGSQLSVLAAASHYWLSTDTHITFFFIQQNVIQEETKATESWRSKKRKGGSGEGKRSSAQQPNAKKTLRYSEVIKQ